MADQRMDPKQEAQEQRSASPEGWPGIPGRSAEHERKPESPAPEHEDAEVTEAQRELERESAK